MRRLILSSSPFLVCVIVMFYLSSGNAPRISRNDLLLWHITLYATISGVGWRLYDRFPPYRLAIRRVTLWFTVLIMLNETTPEVFRWRPTAIWDTF